MVPLLRGRALAAGSRAVRFGTLKGLGQTHSAVDDNPSNIPTLSFHGSTYTSKYLVFTPVETQDTNGKTLDTPPRRSRTW